jgi:hypothetical protein
MAAIVTALGVGCGTGSGSGGACNGIRIPESDTSPPGATFGIAAQGGPTTTVTIGGAPQTGTLPTKTGPLNLLVTAKDSESGVKDVQIWMTKRTTTCSGGTCTTAGPGLVGQPRFSNPRTGNTGDCVAESSIVAQSIDLATEIPQAPPPAGGSRSVSLQLWAVVINYRDANARTPVATIDWKEP